MPEVFILFVSRGIAWALTFWFQQSAGSIPALGRRSFNPKVIMKKLLSLLVVFASLCSGAAASVSYINSTDSSTIVRVKVTPVWLRYVWSNIDGFPQWSVTTFTREPSFDIYYVSPLDFLVIQDEASLPGSEPLGKSTGDYNGQQIEVPGDGYNYEVESVDDLPAVEPPEPSSGVLDPMYAWPDMALLVKKTGGSGGLYTNTYPYTEQVGALTITLGESLDIKVIGSSPGYLQWVQWWCLKDGETQSDTGSYDFVYCTPSSTQQQVVVLTRTFTPASAGVYTIIPAALATYGWDGIPVTVTVVAP